MRITCNARQSRRDQVFHAAYLGAEELGNSMTLFDSISLREFHSTIHGTSMVDYCDSVLAGAPGHLLDRLLISARKSEHTHHCTMKSTGSKFLRGLNSGYVFWRIDIFTAQRHHTSHRRRSSPSPSVRRVTDSLGAVKTLFNSGRPCVSDIAASRALNSLSAAVRDTLSLLCFPRRLKTLLSQSSFHC